MLKGTEEENTEEISENFDEQERRMEENEEKTTENLEEKKEIGENEENIGEKFEKEGKLEEKEERIKENLYKDKKTEEKEEKTEENFEREEKFKDSEEKGAENLEKVKLKEKVSKQKDFEKENGTKLKKNDGQIATEQFDVNEFVFIKLGDFEDDQFLALKYGEFLGILSRNEDGEKARKAWSPALKQIEEKENLAKCATTEHSLAHLLDIGILANEIWHYVQTMKALNGKSKDLAKFEKEWAQLKQLKLEEEIIQITHQKNADFLVWSPGREWFTKKQFGSGKIPETMAMPIISPLFPEQNEAYRINLSTAKVIQNELKLAFLQIRNMNETRQIIEPILGKKKFTEKYEHFVTFVCAGTEWNVEKFCHFVGKRLGHELLHFVEQSSANLINVCHIYPKLVHVEQQLSEDKKWKNLQKRIWLVGLKLQKQKKRNDEALTSELKAVLSSKFAEIDAKIKNDFEGKRYYNVRLNSEFVERLELENLGNF
ncbi:hypothetical protein niasHT_011471 [Heterodera trifolii]|uniref:Polynucleotide adenylyltransferase n=1 Tax=Heterodera trifolii TaxID=157864 RepID=A0ABD2L169_9BILA